MTSIAYTSAVGQKFFEDGRPRTFPGNTIICFVSPESHIFQLTEWVQAQIQSLPFAHKFAFLPPSSFHMTVMELLCDQVRTSKMWSAALAIDASLDELDNFFIQTISNLPPPAVIRMQFVETNRRTCALHLAPADEETAEALRAYRNAIAEAAHVRFPNHDEYQFHISLAYRLIELTPDEEAILGRTLTGVEQHLKEHFGLFEPTAPQLTFFDDMFRFVPADQRNLLSTR